MTLIADRATGYADTRFNDTWLADHDLDPGRYSGALEEFERSAAGLRRPFGRLA